MLFIPSLSSRTISLSPPLTILSLGGNEIRRAISLSDPTQAIIKDSIFTVSNSLEYVTDYDMAVLIIGGTGISNVEWESDNLLVGSVDDYGNVTHIADGTATITATVGNAQCSKTLTLSTYTTEGAYSFSSYTSGSLANHISTFIDTTLSGKNSDGSLALFSSYNGSTAIKNSNFWCDEIDFSCISSWNSMDGKYRAGTLISPRHILFAAHYQIDIGSTLTFVGTDGSIITRTLIGKAQHPNYNSSTYYPDIAIGILDSDVPETVNFCKILPNDWASYLPNINNTQTLPVVKFNQNKNAYVGELYNLSNVSYLTGPRDNKRLEFAGTIITGDSGNPAFLIIDNEPVLLCVWTFGGNGAGTFVTNHISTINYLMSMLGDSYQLTEISLASFETYE